MYVVPSRAMWQIFVFCSGLSSENSLFYSILRLRAMSEMTHHTPTKCLFLQCLQLVPANILWHNRAHICKLHFALRFLWFFRKPNLPHCTWRYHPYIYIYMHAAGCLFEPPFCCNVTKPAKMYCEVQSQSSKKAPKKTHAKGVQLRTRKMK